MWVILWWLVNQCLWLCHKLIFSCPFNFATWWYFKLRLFDLTEFLKFEISKVYTIRLISFQWIWVQKLYASWNIKIILFVNFLLMGYSTIEFWIIKCYLSQGRKQFCLNIRKFFGFKASLFMPNFGLKIFYILKILCSA